MASDAVKARPVFAWPQSQAGSWSQLWPGLLLPLLVFLAYSPALHCGFIWDDDVYITRNPLLSAPDGLRRIWFSLDSPSQYFPLTYTTFRLEYSLWGSQPFGYHFDNILLHAANAWLVWWLLRRLAVPGAWLGAALFALHPVQVESVAWATERKNVLSLLFFLLALHAWIQFAINQPRPAWRWYGLAILCHALALCAKSTACTLPAALLLVLWLKRERINWLRWMQLLPFFMLSLGMGLVTMWWERYHQHTEGAAYGFNWLDRLLLASRAIWFYTGKLLWPANLAFSYPGWTVNARDPAAYGWLAACFGLCVLVYFLRQFAGRSLEVAIAFYWATLSPLLGFIMLATFQYSFVADHYQYVACIGPLSLAAAGFALIPTPARGEWPFLKPVLAAAVLLVLAVLTWRQTHIYRDPETLWRDTLAKNPGSWMAYDNLGYDFLQRGRLDDAMSQFRKSIEINPNRVTSHNDYAEALRQSGRLAEAETEMQKALALAPDMMDVRLHWAKLLVTEGKLDQAVEEYKTILQMLAPSDRDHLDLAETELGDALSKLGRLDEAIGCFRRLLQREPDNTQVRTMLGRTLCEMGDLPGAQAEFNSVLRHDARDAEAIDGLGYVLALQGNTDQARSRFLQAMQLDPKDAFVYFHYAMLLSGQGRIREAVVQYQKALALDDQLFLACNNLAWILATCPDAQIRNGAQAVDLAERACRLTGNAQPFLLGTLAAAYAETGRFSQAVQTAEKAISLARKMGQNDLAARNEQLLEFYRTRRPYHAPLH